MSAPRIQKRKKLLVGDGARTRTTGWVGPTDRGTFGYVTERHSHDHRIRALNAYAISNRVLDRLKRAGVDTILVVETDTDTVLEFPRAMYHGPSSAQVPDRFLHTGNDPQRYVARPNAVEWPDHAATVYIPRGEEVRHG